MRNPSGSKLLQSDIARSAPFLDSTNNALELERKELEQVEQESELKQERELKLETGEGVETLEGVATREGVGVRARYVRK